MVTVMLGKGLQLWWISGDRSRVERTKKSCRKNFGNFGRSTQRKASFYLLVNQIFTLSSLPISPSSQPNLHPFFSPHFTFLVTQICTLSPLLVSPSSRPNCHPFFIGPFTFLVTQIFILSPLPLSPSNNTNL